MAEETTGGKKVKGGPRSVRASKAAGRLAWVFELDHRRIFDDDGKKGLIFYHLKPEYKGHIFNKFGLLPIYETEKSGTIQRFRPLKSKTGKQYLHWDVITMSESEARKLADAIYDMLGAKPQSVQPDGTSAPEKPMSEQDETEALLRKFRGA